MGVQLNYSPVLRSPPVAFTRCVNCDGELIGGSRNPCYAARLLYELADDLHERDEIIDRELEQGADEADTYRSARWYMYRQYVILVYGHLGQHNRVRLPECVVGFIRARYRAPGCTCVTMEEIARCTEHGYKGFVPGRGRRDDDVDGDDAM